VDVHGKVLPILPIICSHGHCESDNGTCTTPKQDEKYCRDRAFLLSEN
jgi:hypothetical protein